jgi:hypothetical protein
MCDGSSSNFPFHVKGSDLFAWISVTHIRSSTHGTNALKGLCHEMNNFVEGLKNQISTLCMCAASFYIFLLPCYGKNKR